MQIHTGERPSKCDICDQTFRKLGSLNGHKQTHAGKTPYQCNIRTVADTVPTPKTLCSKIKSAARSMILFYYQNTLVTKI